MKQKCAMLYLFFVTRTVRRWWISWIFVDSAVIVSFWRIIVLVKLVLIIIWIIGRYGKSYHRKWLRKRRKLAWDCKRDPRKMDGKHLKAKLGCSKGIFSQNFTLRVSFEWAKIPLTSGLHCYHLICWRKKYTVYLLPLGSMSVKRQ